MTATARHETPLLPPKDGSDTSLPFSWAVVRAPACMNDSEDRSAEKSRVGLVSPHIRIAPRGRNDNRLTDGLQRGDGSLTEGIKSATRHWDGGLIR